MLNLISPIHEYQCFVGICPCAYHVIYKYNTFPQFFFSKLRCKKWRKWDSPTPIEYQCLVDIYPCACHIIYKYNSFQLQFFSKLRCRKWGKWDSPTPNSIPSQTLMPQLPQAQPHQACYCRALSNKHFSNVHHVDARIFQIRPILDQFQKCTPEIFPYFQNSLSKKITTQTYFKIDIHPKIMNNVI